MFELLERSEPRNGWVTIRGAVNGHPAIPFDVHLSDIENFRTDKEFLGFCERQTVTLVEQYGDVREQRLQMEVV